MIETDRMTITSPSGKKKYLIHDNNTVIDLSDRPHEFDKDGFCIICGISEEELTEAILNEINTDCKPKEKTNGN